MAYLNWFQIQFQSFDRFIFAIKVLKIFQIIIDLIEKLICIDFCRLFV